MSSEGHVIENGDNAITIKTFTGGYCESLVIIIQLASYQAFGGGGECLSIRG